MFNCKIRELEFNLQVANNKVNIAPVSLSWISPVSGLAMSNIDFPLNLNIKVTNFNTVAKINFYYSSEENEIKSIGSIENISSENNNFGWEEAPASGTYQISAEAVTWSKKSYKLEPITVIVNNIDN